MVDDLDRAANAMCAWLLEHIQGQAHEELCDLHPETWKEAAEVAVRAARGEFDARPFTTSPDRLTSDWAAARDPGGFRDIDGRWHDD